MIRRLMRLLVLMGVIAGVAVVARNVAATRTPRRALDGSGAITGSLDTWPPVPRAPEASRPAE